MAMIKDQVKESLVGTIVEPSLSTDAQATFERNAKKDEGTGELYMTEEEFVNAIAPSNEDYVGPSSAKHVTLRSLQGCALQQRVIKLISNPCTA